MFIDQSYVQSTLPRRPADAHKGSCGTVLSVCGSKGMAGAAYFAAAAALRSGAGLVRAAADASIYPILATLLPEAVYLLDADADTLCKQIERADAAVIGCGLGTDAARAALLPRLLDAAACPVVLDADGINLAAAHTDIAQRLSERCILTPHPAEMARLLQCSTEAVQSDRAAAVRQAAARFGCVAVLKGHHTLVADASGRVVTNPTGNAGMASGGMGDVLAGIIASLAAQGLSPWDAACCGVWLHGAAGDAAAQKHSMRALLPRDVLQALQHIFARWEQEE